MVKGTQDWQALVEQSVAFRRELHRHPELSWAEQATAQKIRQRLDALGIAWRECADTGTLATLAAGRSGRHIALRADIDALPMHEDSGVQWQSETEGCMHACGHDGHTASLYAAAAWLKQHEADLPGPVTLVFQPAEEGGHGAKRMIEAGALEGIDAIFGWHNWPAIPYGQAVCPDGTVMAGNGTFKIELHGRGGHASQPEQCRDPLLAGSAIVVALQQIVSRRFAPQQAVVLSVTSFDARSGVTVIPETAVLEGSFRLADASTREPMTRWITEIAERTAGAYGVQCDVTVYPRYDATVNHPAEAEHYRQALQSELGPHWMSSQTPLPIMASEDFSYYLKERPGAFALIGSADGNETHHHPCHSPKYDFNDALIPQIARIYSRLVGAPIPPADA
ncbi:MAG: N(2)-acetyl-L-2,4-diaminobutanoate deacetylase DoeB2 [Saccharospirillum sp.]